MTLTPVEIKMTIGSSKQWSYDWAVSQADQLIGQCSPFYFQDQRAIKYPSCLT